MMPYGMNPYAGMNPYMPQMMPYGYPVMQTGYPMMQPMLPANSPRLSGSTCCTIRSPRLSAKWRPPTWPIATGATTRKSPRP